MPTAFEGFKSGNTIIPCKDVSAFPRSEQAVLGAKNFLPYPYNETTKTMNGTTFTDNGDGTITLTNSATARATFMMMGVAEYFHPKAGKYKLSKGFAHASIGVGVNAKNGSTYVKNIISTFNNDDVEFEVDYDGYDRLEVYIDIGSATEISSPIIVKPMVRLASDPDDTYAAYAMTNKELTEKQQKYVEIFSTDDLDNCTDIHTTYLIKNAYVPLHAPEADAYNALIWNIGEIGAGKYLMQFYSSSNKNTIYFRFNAGAIWHTWNKITSTTLS